MAEHEPIAADSRLFTCLIVEDDAGFGALEARVIQEEGGRATLCPTLATAMSAIQASTFDLVLLDNHLPDGKAYDWYERFSRRNPEAPVVMITGLPDLTEAISLTRNGLFEYLNKPIDRDALAAVIRRARLRLRHPHQGEAKELISGASPRMNEVLTQLRQAARHRTATVLLTGESGTGKDVAARALHQLTYGGVDASAAYVAVNCAAVPAEMFEAELFGAERGAYTGADRRRAGLVGAAQGGTLFLDEIGEVPLALQAKLLRFLEGREFRALGASEAQVFNGRFIAATNKDLRAEVASGRFREDLLFRLEVFPVALPPLRDRLEDLPALAERLLAQLTQRYERPPLLLQPADLSALRQHSFPGNVRELRNILERSLLRTPEESRWLVLDSAGIATNSPHPSVAPPMLASSAAPASPQVDVPPAEGLPPERADLPPIEAQEYLLIQRTLRETNGGIRRAAAKLGLSPQALLRRLEKWPELRP